MATTVSNHQKAVKEVAKLIKQIDASSFLFEYLKTGKGEINAFRKKAFEILGANGYELGDAAGNYTPKKKKV
jgi:hypothetical protein